MGIISNAARIMTGQCVIKKYKCKTNSNRDAKQKLLILIREIKLKKNYV